ATQQNVIGKATAVANDPDDWNELTRTAGSPTDIGADASKASSSSSTQVATASASPAMGLADAAGMTVAATPTTAVAISPKTARPTVPPDGAQAAPGVVVAGPLPLTTTRHNRTGQSAVSFPWSPPALSSDDS